MVDVESSQGANGHVFVDRPFETFDQRSLGLTLQSMQNLKETSRIRGSTSHSKDPSMWPEHAFLLDLDTVSL
jgi:hypothetical protein